MTETIDRCQATLETAISGVPFYQRWTALDPGPSQPFSHRIAALPVLTKRDLRVNSPHGFIHRGLDYKSAFASGEIEMVTTSGTLGERLSVVWNQQWWDRSEREGARLNQFLERVFRTEHREAILTTPVCAGNVCHVGRASMTERTSGNLLFLNQDVDPTAWDDLEIRRMAQEIEAFTPEIIEADPAYLAIFARHCLERGYALFRPECIVLTYEFPSQMHIRAIRSAFPNVPVISSYGATETGHVFVQCQEGIFHENTATCHVDIQSLRPEFGEPEVGRILVTTLDNPWLTLLHYDVGDLARIRRGPSCSFGRVGGLEIESIEGRTAAMTFDTKGRAVTLKRLDDALAAEQNLTGYRMEQTGPREFSMRYTTAHGTGQVANTIASILHTVYGVDASIELNLESILPPEQSGKFRLARLTWEKRIEDLFS